MIAKVSICNERIVHSVLGMLSGEGCGRQSILLPSPCGRIADDCNHQLHSVSDVGVEVPSTLRSCLSLGGLQFVTK